jgi:hypothetical protein
VNLTDSTLLAAASNTLTAAGFQEVSVAAIKEIDPTRERLFEDAYSIVLVTAFQSAEELVGAWPAVQTGLAALITRTMARTDAKVWDGYLVLMLGRQPSRAEVPALSKIAYDTRRVRKIVVTPDMIGSDLDLTTALLPVLPLSELPSLGPRTSLEQVLTTMEGSLAPLARRGLEALFEASASNSSPFSALEALVREAKEEGTA